MWLRGNDVPLEVELSQLVVLRRHPDRSRRSRVDTATGGTQTGHRRNRGPVRCPCSSRLREKIQASTRANGQLSRQGVPEATMQLDH